MARYTHTPTSATQTQFLLQALTSKVSLRRLSPTFSSKSTAKVSLASQKDADSDAEGEADAVQEPQEALAKRMLRRSTNSFKIGAKKLGAAVKPACFGKSWQCSSLQSLLKTQCGLLKTNGVYTVLLV